MQHQTDRVWNRTKCLILLRGVVGPPHGEKPLEGVSGIGMLYDALGLQVSHQQRDGLQELLLWELQAEEERGGGSDQIKWKNHSSFLGLMCQFSSVCYLQYNGERKICTLHTFTNMKIEMSQTVFLSVLMVLKCKRKESSLPDSWRSWHTW